MSSLVKTVFGGTDSSAQDAQISENKAGRELFEKLANQARGDAMSLDPAAQANLNMGFQGALDILGQTIPQQAQTFQQGNVGAQQQLLAGLPQIQNAILGNAVNMQGLQPTTVGFDTSFAQQQLPQFQTSTDALQQGQALADARNPQFDINNISPEDAAALLAQLQGLPGFGQGGQAQQGFASGNGGGGGQASGGDRGARGGGNQDRGEGGPDSEGGRSEGGGRSF